MLSIFCSERMCYLFLRKGPPHSKCHILIADRKALCDTGVLIKELNQSQEKYMELPFGFGEP